MKRPVFDNLRWDEMGIAIGTAAVGVYVPTAQLPELLRLTLVAFVMLLVAASFLRNPKNLEWKEKKEAPKENDGTDSGTTG